MRHPQPARLQALHGRERVLAEYDWDGLAKKLELAWQQAAEASAITAKST